jgi:7-cyano-7-deazaguanine reductase
MDEIEKIASKVLGKTSDGKTMMRYETPDEVDRSLLVGIPRYLNRTQYDIKDDGSDLFVGIDTWNGYEFSCLLDNGFPVSGLLKWSYPSDSECIVESKSAKLYLNSYNMAKMGETVEEAIANVEQQVSDDLYEVLGVKEGHELSVCLHVNEDYMANPMRGTFLPLEEIVDVASVEFNHYNEDPDILDIELVDSTQTIKYQSTSLRSNCRVTNQPDWGDIYIQIKGDRAPTPESLLQYIVSMRTENHFHEEICECVYKRLHDLLGPDELMVGCLYTRRGGIDINPVRASSQKLLLDQPITDAFNMTRKTMRQ